jgi:hypothetical protein
MSQATLNTTLTARDAASKSINNVTRNLGGLSTKATAVGAAIGTALGGIAVMGLTKLVGFVQSSIGAASNMNETMSKTQAIFGDATQSVLDFAASAGDSLGLSKQQALDASSTFAVFGKSAGLAGGDLSKFSGDLVGLSADFASFYNTSPQDAIVAIGAALRGESEPIRRYNVLLNDASLRQTAFEMGIVSTTKKALTPQQKVLAAQAEILKQSKVAQGDFMKTSKGMANQQRILAAQVANLSAEFGEAFLPIMTEVMGFMSTTIVPLFREKLVPIIATLKEVLTKVVDEVKKFLIPIWEKLQPVLAKISWNFMVLKGRVQGFIRDVLVPLWNTIKWRVMVAMGQLSGFMRDVVGPAVDGLGKALQGDLGKALIVVAGAIMGVVVAMKIYQGAMAAYAIIMKAIQLPTIIFTALQAALNVVMSMNPIMLVVLAIAALVGAFIAAYTFIEPFRQAVDTVFGALMAFGKFIIDVLVGAFELFGKVIGRIGEGIMNSPFGLFLRLAIEVAKGIGGIIDSVFGGGDDKPKPLPAGSSGGTMFPGLATVGQPAGTGSATFGGIPPAQTTVNVTLDGKAVAQSVDTRIGRGAGSGGRNQ